MMSLVAACPMSVPDTTSQMRRMLASVPPPEASHRLRSSSPSAPVCAMSAPDTTCCVSADGAYLPLQRLDAPLLGLVPPYARSVPG
eukprot:3941931-Rhodomonas_salina.1